MNQEIEDRIGEEFFLMLKEQEPLPSCNCGSCLLVWIHANIDLMFEINDDMRRGAIK